MSSEKRGLILLLILGVLGVKGQSNFSTLPYVGRTLYIPIPFPVLYSEEIPEDVYIRVSPELTDEFFHRYPTIKTIFKGMRRRSFACFFFD